MARAAYPKGTLAMRLRDELGDLYRDEQYGYCGFSPTVNTTLKGL
jgi:hypothetical protein